MMNIFKKLALTFIISVPSVSKADPNTNAIAQFVNQNRSGQMLPQEQSAETLLESIGDKRTTPFGANLFAGGYESERIDGLSEDYLIAPGDKINIWIWGAVSFSQVVTVDNQGNIFLPNIGPVSVLNTKASQVNQKVTAAIKRVYKKGVQVYVNLLSATPVSVLITGNIMRPGQYAGLANDSLLYYLKRAGGIDNERGSYRYISHYREGKLFESYDLYSFLRNGKLKKYQFNDGDTLVVEKVGPQIKVNGKARYPFAFELKTQMILGKELIEMANIEPSVSHVGVSGTRKKGPLSIYLPIRDFNNLELRDGDTILFNDDLRADVLDIKVSGSYKGPSYYSVKKETRLQELLASIEVDPNLADVKSIYVNRASIAKKQKQALEDSLQRLERSVFTAPASSDGEARIRAQEAQLVMEFVQRARTIEPSGRVVVSDGKNVANIQLENEDEIVIPAKNDLVLVSGEVLLPQAIVYKPDANVEDYVAWAGGFTERAEDDDIPVLKPNGMLVLDGKTQLRAGDQIIVLPKIDSKNMQLVKDITQIVYQLAIAGSVIDRLND